MPSDTFKRILKRIYFRHFHAPGSPPDRLTIEFNYFDSDFKFLRIEAFDPVRNKFDLIGYLPSHSTYHWRSYRIGFPVSSFPVRFAPNQIFRLQRPPLPENHVIVFTGINLYLGHDYDETKYFLDGLEIVPNTSIKLVKTLDAGEEEIDYTGSKIGWTEPFVFHKKVSAGFLPDAKAGCAYFGFEQIARKIKGVNPSFEEAGSPAAESGQAETIIIPRKAVTSATPVSQPRPSFEPRPAAKITVESEKISGVKKDHAEAETKPAAQTISTPSAPKVELKSSQCEPQADKAVEKTSGPAPASIAKAPQQPSELSSVPVQSAAAPVPESASPVGVIAVSNPHKVSSPVPAPPAATVIPAPAPALTAAKSAPPAVIEPAVEKPVPETIATPKIIVHSGKIMRNEEIKQPPAASPAATINAEPPDVAKAAQDNIKVPAAAAAKKPVIVIETTASFFSEDENWPETVKRLDPGFVSHIVSSADSILTNEFSVHYRRIKFEGGINWNSDFEGGDWPDEPAEKTFDEISRSAGRQHKFDPVLTLELARHQELVVLALAFRFTNDSRYLSRLTSIFSRWHETAKPGRGITYASVGAVADRLVSWFLAHELVASSPEATQELKKASFTDEFNFHLQFVLENALESKLAFSPTEALTAQILCHGILSLVKFHKRSEKLDALVEKIKKGLEACLTPDGGHVSGSALGSYVIFQSLIFACAASKKAENKGLPQGVKPFHELKFVSDCVRAQAAFIRSVSRPDGSVQCLSEYYAPKRRAFGTAGESDAQADLQLYAYIFNDKEQKFMTAGHRVYEIAMLFGESGTASFAKLPVAVPGSPDAYFKNAGYICLCSSLSSFSASNYSTQIVFDCGRTPERVLTPEAEKGSHTDLFSFTLTHGGTAFITDPGSALFPKKPKFAEYMSSHYAHNTIVINRSSPRIPGATGETGPEPFAEDLKYSFGQDASFVTATHSGYMKDGLECTLRRTLVFVKPYYVLLLDDIMTARKKPTYFDVEALFHLSPDVTYEQMNSIFHQRATILSSRKSEARVVKITQCAQKVANMFYRGSQNPIAGWHCPEYGALSESTTIVNHLRFVKIPVRIYSLFYLLGPDDNLNSILMNLGIQYNKANLSIDVTHRDMKDVLKFNEKLELTLKRNKL